MKTLFDFRPCSKIHITHGPSAADGRLECLEHPTRYEIVLPSSGLFNQLDVRIPVTAMMLGGIQLLPNGSYQLEF
jgi:hypothetical protein